MSSWREINIGETGRYINGLAFKPTDWETEGRPIIRIQNLTDASKPFNRTTKPVEPAFVVEPGDLLVSWSATLDAFIWNREPGVLNQHIFKVVPNTEIVSKRFLYYGLKRAITEMVKSEHLHGSTMKHINRGPFLAHKIRVPSLQQQEEVVADIEKQLSRLDEAVAGLQRVKANLKRYKAAVLKSAVVGRLVPTEADLARRGGRRYETGAQLLQRILETRRSLWQGKGKYKEPAAPETADLPELPEGWGWSTVDQNCSQITDGEHIQPRYQPTGHPMLTAKNVRDGFVDFGDVGYIAEIDFEACLRRCAPKEGDLLIVSVGATTGRTAIVGPCQPFALVRSVLLLRPADMIPSTYLLYWLQSPWCQTRIQRASGATAQAHLYIKDTKAIPVPLPPLAEQHRIVAEVDRLLSIAREAEAEVDANLKRAQGLRQAILSKAFCGGLK